MINSTNGTKSITTWPNLDPVTQWQCNCLNSIIKNNLDPQQSRNYVILSFNLYHYKV